MSTAAVTANGHAPGAESAAEPKSKSQFSEELHSSTNAAAAAGNDGPASSPKHPAFCEDTASILAKYAKSPPSIELHIHPTHYRFSGQDGIIPKNNPVMEIFLQSVRDGVLPAVASEVFRDSGITLYEGCAILKLVDYRNFNAQSQQQKTEQEFDKPVTDRDFTGKPDALARPQPKESETTAASDKSDSAAGGESQKRADEAAPGAPAEKNADEQVSEDGKKQSSVPPVTPSKPQPPSFRVLLRPTGCNLLNDLMGLSDAGTGRRLTDFFAISMESEILNATIRHLDLRRPNRHEYDTGLKSELALLKGKRAQRYFKHRLTHPRKMRRIVEESPHKGSAYEDFMLGMADLERPIRGSSQFVRMSFIEQLRRKKNITPAVTGTSSSRLSSGGGAMRNNFAGGDSRPAVATSTTATPSSTTPTLNLPPTKISQPSPSQLGRQLFQSQQMAQQSSRLQQQALVHQLAMNHVPPGPTAQHQIQAQHQQQAILRARAQQQQQMMRQGSPPAGAAQGAVAASSRIPPRQGAAQTAPSNAVGVGANSAGSGTAGSGSHVMPPQMQRPVSAMNPVAAGQRTARPLSRMNRMSAGMPMNQMGMMNGQMGMMGSNGVSMNNPINRNQMENQMASQINGQISNPIGNQMGANNQLNGQLGSQMNSPIASQIGNQIGNQMGNQMGLGNQMANQMNGPLGNNQVSPPAAGQLSPQMGISSPHLGNQMGINGGGQMNSPMNTQMGMNQMGMPPSASSPMQAPSRLSQMSSGSLGNVPMHQQVPTQVPSQIQQMQGRRPSQLTQAQMRQLMLNRARAQQQARQQAEAQQAQPQSGMGPSGYLPSQQL